MPSLSQLVSRFSLRRKGPSAKQKREEETAGTPKEGQGERQRSTSPSTHSSSTTSLSINVDVLEFDASRDLARSLGQDWAPIKKKREIAAFPAFEFLLQPPSPATESPSRNTSVRFASASKSNINRWSIHGSKSALLKRVRSTPNFAPS